MRCRVRGSYISCKINAVSQVSHLFHDMGPENSRTISGLSQVSQVSHVLAIARARARVRETFFSSNLGHLGHEDEFIGFFRGPCAKTNGTTWDTWDTALNRLRF